MNRPEQGAGWEVHRQFVSPEKVERAATQAWHILQDLDVAHTPYLSELTNLPENTIGLRRIRVHTWDKSKYPSYPNTLDSFPDERLAYSDLLETFYKTQATFTSDSRGFFLHQLSLHGRTRRHRDRNEGDTAVLSLYGDALCNIKDPVQDTWYETVLHPGDVMYLQNPRPQRLRPLHIVRNVGKTARLSLVC